MPQEFNLSDPTVTQWKSASSPEQIRGIPNFFSMTNLGKTSQITNAAQLLVIAAIVAAILRVFSRRRTKTKFLLDDGCACLAAFFLVTNQMVVMEVYNLGIRSFTFVGKFSDEEEMARRAQIVVGLKLSLAFEVMYLISIFLVKFSLLFLYERFARQTQGITLYLRITQGICAITFAACILSLFLSCIPIAMFWSLTSANEQCTRRMLLTYTSGISNIVTNTLVLAVPVPLLLRATLTRRQKIGLSVLYFFGAFVVMGSALRFVTQLLNVSVPQAMGWSQLEVSLALILVCAPMATKLLLMPLLDVRRERERLEKGMETQVDSPSQFMSKLMEEGDAREREGRRQVPRRGLVVKDIESPDYRNLRLVKEEVDGQTVWEVRPMSPAAGPV